MARITRPLTVRKRSSFQRWSSASRHAGVDWDAYLSCEFLRAYKPDPSVYLTAARLLGAEPDEVMMVAVHPPDLLASQRAGLKTAYVKSKLWEPGAEGPTNVFDLSADDYGALACQLCEPPA